MARTQARRRWRHSQTETA